MKRGKAENRETAPWIDPMTPNLSPLTFCLPLPRGRGADLVIKFQIALHHDVGGENLGGALLGGGAETSAEHRIRDERDEGLNQAGGVA